MIRVWSAGGVRRAYILGALLLAFGYSTGAVWALLFGLPTGVVNLSLKALVALFFLISLPYMLRRMVCVCGAVFPIIFFLALYALRLIYDVVFRDIQIMGSQSQFYVLSYFFGLTLLPVLSVAGAARVVDLKRLAEWSFGLLILANASLIVFAFNSGLDSFLLAFAGRLQADGSADGTTVLNPIGIGLMGACLAAVSIARLVFVSRISIGWSVVNFTSLFVGMANILLGASRGPAIAFALCLVAVTISAVRSLIRGGQNKIKARALLVAILPLAVSLWMLNFSDRPIFLFERFSDFIENRAAGVGEERDLIRERAWDDFVNSPIFGSSYVVSLENSLAHNIVFEGLISVGAFGFLVLFWALVNIVRAILCMWAGSCGLHGYAMGLVGLCFLVVQMTSGTIGQTPEFWVFSTLLVVFAHEVQPTYRRSVNATVNSAVDAPTVTASAQIRLGTAVN